MRPFLKWAGGKYRLIERIKTVLPEGRRLVEPFIGSGAVFLNTSYPAYLLADSNRDLIVLYTILQQDGPSFIDDCRAFFTAANNTADRYYALRTTFNTTHDPRLKAALFLYLNRHGYNGLCRYNRKGGFNVPFGSYKKPYFPEREMRFFHAQAQTAVFQHADFAEIMQSARPGDVVYCDPPYAPLSSTANFTSYSHNRFGNAEQHRLAGLAAELAARGVPVIISNHDTPFTQTVYADAETVTFDVRRFISRDGSRREAVPELLAVFS